MTNTTTVYPSPESHSDTPDGIRSFTAPELRALNQAIQISAETLRAAALLMGGMIEHHAVCNCPDNNPNHNALVLVIPEPYLSAYQKYLPDFMTAIMLEVDNQTSHNAQNKGA